jgi:hypothetical protein
MKKVILMIVLLSGFGMADITCIDYGGGMKVCTDDETGKDTTIWTF